jgi:putative N6-adenine-specific DNA methylase
MDKLFAVTAPGLELFTVQELQQMELLPERHGSTAREPGGVEFTGDLETIYRVNLWLRTCSRLLLRLGEFHAAAFSELNKHTRQLPWEQFIIPGQGVTLRVTCHKSRLYHSGAVAREIIIAIGAHLGKSVNHVKFNDDQAEPIPQLVIVRLVNDQCTISLDTSGQHLHRRGYRLATAKAPLRETLAAGLLLASGWDTRSPLLDPFCGSGTIAIEGALLANRIAPGNNRRFAFMDWPSFQPELWNDIHTSDSGISTQAPAPLLGREFIMASDRDEGAIKIARENAERAGVAKHIEFTQRTVSAIQPRGTGWIVTNPPYGMRTGSNKDVRNLYAQFGKVLRQMCPGWHIAIMCSDLALLAQLNLPLDKSIPLINGGIKVLVGCSIVPMKPE